jgi:hypothetical protein
LDKHKSDVNCDLEEQSTSSIKQQDRVDDKEMLDLVNAEEKKRKDNSSYRTVGRTLKAVINQSLDYGIIHERLQRL